MTNKISVLGLNAAGFNTSCALLIDGQPVFAVEEERLVREKRCRRFPAKGINLALEKAGIDLLDLDAIAVGWNPSVNLESFGGAHSGQARFLGEIFYRPITGGP